MRLSATSDPSIQLIVAEDAPYLKNMAALWTIDPALAAEIEAADMLPPYKVETSRSGLPTVVVKTETARSVYLHSQYEPIAEAKKLIEPVNLDDVMAFFVFGFALGYHVELLFERAASEAYFFVFEPDLLLLRTAFEQRDLSRAHREPAGPVFHQSRQNRNDASDHAARGTDLSWVGASHPPGLCSRSPVHFISRFANGSTNLPRTAGPA